MTHYDAIIIGSGQAGTPLVFSYASHKKKVAFIEKKHFGGTCLNVGCTPSKNYVASAKRMYDVQYAGKLGIDVPKGAKANLSKIKQRKDKPITLSHEKMSSSIDKNEYIDFFNGEAHFVDDKIVEVNNKKLTADKIFINVGARARIPDDFEHIDYLTNEEIFELTEIPEHLIIVGGSYIGLEFSQMFRRFGSKVTVVEQNSRLLAQEDEDISDAIKEILEDEGIEFRTDATCIGATQQADNRVKVFFDCDAKNEEIIGTHVLLAAGRIPNTDLLNLNATGISTDKKGYIQVDDRLQTNIEGVYALGDCNGKGAFTHTSYNDFEIVSDYLFGDGTRKVSDRIFTYALFIDPPLGRAGMNVAEAKKTYKNVKVAEYSMSNVTRAMEKSAKKGFMRIIINGDTDRIIGASIFGIDGNEIISGILNIMYADKPYTVIRDSVQIDPTVAEFIPTMLENLKDASYEL
ncbi:MAG: mercuric reductase [Bacteroidales bacterium]